MVNINYKKYFEILLDASKLINSSFDLNVALNSIIYAVTHSMDCEAASLFLYDPAKNNLYFKSVSGDVANKIKDIRIKPGEGIVGWVFENRKCAIVADASKDPRHKKDVDKTSGFVTRSLIALPVEYQGNILGVMEILNPKSKQGFDTEDMILFEALASQVAIAIRFCDSYSKLNQENIELKKVIGMEHKIIGGSNAVVELFQLINKISKFDVTVLITGESGTGKELVAQAIHENSLRNCNPFVPINCTALPENLIESELFGHERGAFTGAISTRKGKFESAKHGTLFLDEIGDMGIPMQAKILRVIESGIYERVGGDKPIESDVRIIAATNKNLKEFVNKGTFREDLYYRLNEIHIDLPPLRERKSDIALLVNHFVSIFSSSFKKNVSSVSREVMDLFEQYHWPGNIRELKNVIKATVVLSDTTEIKIDDLPEEIKNFHSKNIIGRGNENNQTICGEYDITESSVTEESLEEIEKRYIIKVLKENVWKKSKAAEVLGISRPTLDSKIRQYGIKMEK